MNNNINTYSGSSKWILCFRTSACLDAVLPDSFHLRTTTSDNPIWLFTKVRNFERQKGDFGCMACGTIRKSTYCTRWKADHVLSCIKLRNTVELSALLDYDAKKKEVERCKSEAFQREVKLIDTIVKSPPKASSVKSPPHHRQPTLKDSISLESVTDAVGKKISLYLTSTATALHSVDKTIFKDMIASIIMYAVCGQLPLDYNGPSRYEVSDKFIPEVAQRVQEEVQKKILPSIKRYGFELSIDGYSTKTEPQHNIILLCNGHCFFLDAIPLEDGSADAVYILSLITKGLELVSQILNSQSVVVIPEKCDLTNPTKLIDVTLLPLS
ncbi:hypothetical protein GEMRC1_001591 [Eukaryota sp. GEM-RC1]